LLAVYNNYSLISWFFQGYLDCCDMTQCRAWSNGIQPWCLLLDGKSPDKSVDTEEFDGVGVSVIGRDITNI